MSTIKNNNEEISIYIGIWGRHLWRGKIQTHEKANHMKRHRHNFYIMLRPQDRKGHGTTEELKATQCKMNQAWMTIIKVRFWQILNMCNEVMLK